MGWHFTTTVIFTHYMISNTNPGVLRLYFLPAFIMFCIVPVWQSDSQKLIMIWRHVIPNGTFSCLCQEGRYFKIRISMDNNKVILLQLRMWVPQWPGTNVLPLAAEWIFLRKESLVSFLVRGNSYQHDNFHSAWQEVENFSFFIYVKKELPFINLSVEYYTFSTSTSWGHLEEVPPLSPDSTFYLVSFNSSWVIDCMNLLSHSTAFSLPECFFEKADLITPFSSSKSPVAFQDSPELKILCWLTFLPLSETLTGPLLRLLIPTRLSLYLKCSA